MRRFITPASHEEYDHALATSPELCRPFAAAMGDLRTADDCLAGYTADCAVGLAGLTLPGAARLAAAVQARLLESEAAAKVVAGSSQGPQN